MANSKLIKEGAFEQIYQLTKEAVDLVAAIREENWFGMNIRLWNLQFNESVDGYNTIYFWYYVNAIFAFTILLDMSIV